MGGGISVHNETDVEIIVTLSQVGPLHWERIEPGDTKKINCGQVWFTVTAKLWDDKIPTAWDVAKPFFLGFGVGSAAVAVGGVVVPFVLVDGAGAGTVVLAKQVITVARGVGGVSALVTEGNKSPETLQCKNCKTWIGITPSERSAEWLAANHVVAVVPAKERGVYANGKTITIRQELHKISGDTCMTLKIIGT